MATTPATKRPVNYLNNKDMLKEIHLSKNTYCYFTDPNYNQYDAIVDLPQAPLTNATAVALSPDIVQQAKEARAARLSVGAVVKVDPNTIPVNDLVFRIMTWDHIPLAPKQQQQQRKVAKKKTAKDLFEFGTVDDLFEELDDPETAKEIDDMVHVRVNFPPFQHFKLNADNQMECVGRSHWKGDLDSGYFCMDHGQTTNKLAKMYIMLCEKFALKYNWRGYTYRDEMQNAAILQLAFAGLRFNECRSNNPFSYFTAVASNAFCRVLNVEKRAQNLRDDLLEINGLNPSWARQGDSPMFPGSGGGGAAD